MTWTMLLSVHRSEVLGTATVGEGGGEGIWGERARD